MSEWIRRLEKQLEESRSECLRLQQQLSAQQVNIRPAERDTVIENADRDHRTLSKDNVIIASHVKQLNDVIGGLRAEKLDLMTQLRKQQLRITHLENLVNQLSKQVDINSGCVCCMCPLSVSIACLSLMLGLRNEG